MRRILDEGAAVEANKRMAYVYRAVLKEFGQKKGIELYGAVRECAKPYYRATLRK